MVKVQARQRAIHARAYVAAERERQRKEKEERETEARAAGGAPGTQFNCFASTKVQILTPEEERWATSTRQRHFLNLLALRALLAQKYKYRRRRRCRGWQRARGSNTQRTHFTHFTGTKVQILTLPAGRRGRRRACGRHTQRGDGGGHRGGRAEGW